ncbi:hypothetical protein SNEBB_010883 [Seison nebaliae]|nr:hypothetical protein SNEBB_010883 [Seison nebaliae]
MNLKVVVPLLFIFYIFIWVVQEIHTFRDININNTTIRIINLSTNNKKKFNFTHLKVENNHRQYFLSYLLSTAQLDFLWKCQMNLPVTNVSKRLNIEKKIKYSNFKNDDEEIYRSIILHLDIFKIDAFLPELKMFYRSWLEMQRYEPLNVHTDLLVFTKCSNVTDIMKNLNCLEPNGRIPLKRMRKNKRKKQGNCFCINYIKLSARSINFEKTDWTNREKAEIVSPIAGSIPDKSPYNIHPHNEYFLNKLSIEIDSKIPFVDLNLIFELKRNLGNLHDYIDSFNIIYEGYVIYQNYDFIMKSDMDTFLTPHFGAYLPPIIRRGHFMKRSFVTGTGGYSNEWNHPKLNKIMQNNFIPFISTFRRLNNPSTHVGTEEELKEIKRLSIQKMLTPFYDFGGTLQQENIGSTWYGTASEAHLLGAITIRAVLHLHVYEFSPIERAGKLGILMWPDWHHGVLTMYGAHIAAHYLSCATLSDIQKNENKRSLLPILTIYHSTHMLDSISTSDEVLSKRPLDHPFIHIHCWHTNMDFSKFLFKETPYCSNQSETLKLYKDTPSHHLPMKIYGLKMACDSNNTKPNYLSTLFNNLSYIYVN